MAHSEKHRTTLLFCNYEKESAGRIKRLGRPQFVDLWSRAGMANPRLFPSLTAALLTRVVFVLTGVVKGCVNFGAPHEGLSPVELSFGGSLIV